MKSSTISQIIALFFVALFLYTGINKLINYREFKEEISISTFLQPVASWIAWILPILELLVSYMLLVPYLRRRGLYASLGLTGIFTIYVGIMLYSGSNKACGCGGVLETLSLTQHFFLDGSLVIIAIGGVVVETKTSNKTNIFQTK